MRRLISKAETAVRLGVHPEHLMRLVKAGRFPSPIKLTNNDRGHVRFDESEVTGFIEAQLAARKTSGPTGAPQAA